MNIARVARKAGDAFLAAMSFSLGYTLWCIKQEIKHKHDLNNEKWKEAVSEYPEEDRGSDTVFEMSRRVPQDRGTRSHPGLTTNRTYGKSGYWHDINRYVSETPEDKGE